MAEFSFEFFPPRTDKGLQNLINVAKKYEALNPSYYSVTFGAGATSQDKTLDTIKALADNVNVALVPHISCVYATQQSTDNLLKIYKDLGIKKLLVLRGDLPPSESLGQFQHAIDLLRYIKDNYANDFALEVAAYPEYHPQSTSAKQDFKFFKDKVDAGACGAVTQYFYNFESFEHFHRACIDYDITIPITPGIMPIYDVQQLERFSNRCGADLPRWLSKELLSFGDDKEAMIEHGAKVVAELCKKVLELGVPGIHFYTLNRYDAIAEIYDLLRSP
ncbi:MAG: methylenetetrahydrofolate reductase [NAD(P)H] [Francisellaceae bacterium]|mgnify:CR=1 FL=1|jgi:methylenetetrahydrofolate reductase (NADPH)|nr:methylenetetrahydrofolate reductase [NAD(P)H] [Francisellaceae bacterium]MBT6208205.1 methylenetetrahydrofolate reductase [NAD(P)H] [Francisellaceae bacterium]MBT6538689.1 methylenetetrahydrofolate reductase [NAD(P)H] [Francisellaceae bacterium]